MSNDRGRNNRPRRELAIDLALIAGLTLFVGSIMAVHFAPTRVLYHDNFSMYGMFRDQLHSLNRFGEVGWWAPHYQTGWPAYYYAMLGDNNCTSPLFVLWGTLSWISGRLGFQADTFFFAYLIHFAFITPLLSTLGMYAVGRQLFHNRTVIRYALIVAAMSPAVAQNAWDIAFPGTNGLRLVLRGGLSVLPSQPLTAVFWYRPDDVYISP